MLLVNVRVALARSARKLVYEAFSYWCMRPQATGVWGLKLLVYEALSSSCGQSI
jgi:hypothetical protein